MDAWRIEVFPQHRQGAAMAAYVWGYRVALLIATTGVISAVSAVGWHTALLGVAALIGLGLVVTLLAPEPPRGGAPRRGGRLRFPPRACGDRAAARFPDPARRGC